MSALERSGTSMNIPAIQFKSLARKNTLKADTLKTMKGTDHDLGFQMNCSYGNAYRIRNGIAQSRS